MFEPTAPANNDFNCAKRGDGQYRRDEVSQICEWDIGKAEALFEEQCLGDGSDH